jgi:hypothetical protein
MQHQICTSRITSIRTVTELTIGLLQLLSSLLKCITFYRTILLDLRYKFVEFMLHIRPGRALPPLFFFQILSVVLSLSVARVQALSHSPI